MNSDFLKSSVDHEKNYILGDKFDVSFRNATIVVVKHSNPIPELLHT
jgi:hypothetical protein